MGNKIQKMQISTSENSKKNSAPLPPLPPLPLPTYHTTSQSAADKKYANLVKEVFNSLPSNIREAFQDFTQNLMKETYIDRTNLLKAIRDFYTINTYKCNNTNGYWFVPAI